MFSMTKSRELDEGQSRYVDVNKRHYGEDVKFYPSVVVIPLEDIPGRKEASKTIGR